MDEQYKSKYNHCCNLFSFPWWLQSNRSTFSFSFFSSFCYLHTLSSIFFNTLIFFFIFLVLRKSRPLNDDFDKIKSMNSTNSFERFYFSSFIRAFQLLEVYSEKTRLKIFSATRSYILHVLKLFVLFEISRLLISVYFRNESTYLMSWASVIAILSKEKSFITNFSAERYSISSMIGSKVFIISESSHAILCPIMHWFKVRQ